MSAVPIAANSSGFTSQEAYGVAPAAEAEKLTLPALQVFRTIEQPNWPANRDLKAYNEMTGCILQDIVQDGDIVFDIGPGRGCRFLEELKGLRPKISAMAVAPHVPEHIPANVIAFAGWAPTFEMPTKDRAKAITDIFAGVSYAMKPSKDGKNMVPAGLDVLIRLANWITIDGFVVACTETTRLGNRHDRDRIARFFHEYMGMKCTFEIYEKFAEGNQKWEEQLRVTIKNSNSYKSLVEKARVIVGRALRGRILWQSKDGGMARIYEVQYPDDNYFKRNAQELLQTRQKTDPSVRSANPQWPDNRNLATYSEMVGFDIAEYMKDGGRIIDSGCGRTCLALKELKELRPRVKCLGLARHVPTAPMGVSAIPAILPDFDFGRLGKAKLIVDIFGAVSFADKLESDARGYEPAALETVVRLALQITPEGGKLVVCTELDRFGDQHAHKRFQEFFKYEMGLDCKFEVYEHFAEANQVMEKQLRIVIDSNRDHDTLVKQAEKIVGIPRSGRVLWHSGEEREEDQQKIYETIFD